MGGNALKKVQTERLNREEFVEVCSTVIHKLSKIYSAEKNDIKILPFFKNKESFGDIDLLISSELIKDKKDFNSKLINELGSPEVAPSADFHIHPFAFIHKGKNYQVDLMFHPRSEISNAEKFYGYNDLHVLINQFSMPSDNNVLNLSFTKKGLVKSIYYDDKKNQKLGEILVESDFYNVLEYLGLNKQKHKEGFSNINEIFDFVINSYNYDKELMREKINNPNNDTKKRLKRPNFVSFINYSESKIDKNSPDYYKGSIEYFDKCFPNVLKKEKEIIEKFEEIQNIKKALDGNEISKVSGLTLNDRRLGILCKSIREKFDNNDENIVEWLKQHTEKDRVSLINDHKKIVINEFPNIIPKKKIKP